MIRAQVPRNLRVRQSIQISNLRVSARAFLIVVGLIFVAGLMIVIRGADPMKTINLTGALIIATLIVFDLRLWGRSIREVARIVVHHYRRQRQLRCEPLTISLPAEMRAVTTARRPRWQEATTAD